MKDAFPDEGDDSQMSLLEAITAELQSRSAMHPGNIARTWRNERNMYELKLPSAGWFVDIQHSDSIQAINRHCATLIADHQLKRIDLSHLTGPVRSLTVGIAQWVREAAIPAGPVHGIIYPSRFGDPGRCWAIWLREMDQGRQAKDEPTKFVESRPIETPSAGNDALREAAEQLDLTIH